MKLSRWFASAFDRIIVCLASIAGVLLISMMLITCYEVLMRYFFNRAPGWVIESSEYMLLYITFLGAAWLLKERGHVSVDMVYERLNPKSRLLLDIVVSIMGVIICLVLTWYSAASTWDHFQRGAIVFGVLEIPMFTLLIIIPVGFLTLSIEFLRQSFEYLGDRRTPDKPEETAAVEEPS